MMNNRLFTTSHIVSLLLFVMMCSLFISASGTSAQSTEYKMLAPLPHVGITEGSATTTTAKFIPGFFKLLIALATGLAVVMLIFGGIKYMSTDAIGGKSDAKGTIENAIWGLMLALSAWLILFTVNPQLVEFNLSITPTPTITPPGGGGGGEVAPSRTLTQQEAISALDIAKVGIVPRTLKLEGIRQIIVDEISRLKFECNCNVVLTSATGGEHSTRTACNHSNGYKVDLRSNAEGTALTSFITGNPEKYIPFPDRDDGAKMYKAPSGAFYALEGNHWDVAKCNL